MRLNRICSVALAALMALSGAAVAQQQVTIGSSPTGLPFTFVNTETNEMDGVLIDVMKAIEADTGLTPVFVPTQFSALVPSLTSGKIDLIVSAMFITEERAKVVDFSDPIYGYGEGAFVAIDDENSYTKWEDFAGKTIGVQQGTTFVELFQKSGIFADVKIYKGIPDIIADVNAGRIDAGLADGPMAAYYIGQGRFPKVKMAEDYVASAAGEFGVALRQGDERRETINKAIARIKEDGTLAEILAKYGLK
ncbi:ABC transporter substrate-binding protein [Pseudogemmobacter faecipullorum]|uniref:Amino acid ABC transporter substrate-binding protein n=1 Tax=Pseudogemmobacter faecipullorum TaxID=2755041 RepID=A0ABS8CNG4_9RHOB|nr:ABC transporter substrate-binding protein [Pseudogemmobacter faecipullorum]MCB5410375.1 amino acid ABC transporter substrate-binding protein [Pseudogemmobacter faecipullorum]